MALLTQAEIFAPLIAGKYTGQPGNLWQRLMSLWMNEDAILDVTLGHPTADEPMHDAIEAAIRGRDHVAMLVLADQAEEAGAPADLCELTRQAVRVQYPS